MPGGSGGAAGSGGGAGSAGTGGASGGGAGNGGEGGQSDGERPVLERPVRQELSCTVTTELQDLGFEWSGGDVGETSSGSFLVWGRPPALENPDAASVELASIDETGALRTPKRVGDFMENVWPQPRVVASSDGMTVLWKHDDANFMSHVRVAELDATGTMTTMPVTVAGLGERLSELLAAPTEDGIAFVFTESAPDDSSHRLRLAFLDRGATTVRDVRDLVTAGLDEPRPSAGAFVPVPGGFAVLYTFSGLESALSLAFLGADGTLRGDPLVLGSPSPWSAQSLLVRGDELVVAFTREVGTFDESNIARYTALARVELATQALRGPIVGVQAPIENEAAVDPVLFAVDDDVGLVWSRGSVIYFCAGCMPDNHLEGVVIDGDDFTPLSALVTMPNTQPPRGGDPNGEPFGGFVRPTVVPVGDHVVVVATLEFHTSGKAASAAFRCTRVP
jgi:hypothetical protein